MLSRRNWLQSVGAATLAGAAGSFLAPRRALGKGAFKAKRVVIVSVAGGLRRRESLGMAEGATLPSMMGDIPIIGGFGAGSAGAAKVAPEYEMGSLVLPSARRRPLIEEGALVANLRYAEGVPGHLQGAACLATGLYNNIDNRADAFPPAPTLFELHRRHNGGSALDAWYLSNVPGFYRVLRHSAHPDYGADFAATWMSPPATMNSIVPLVTRGQRTIQLKEGTRDFPTVRTNAAEIRATRGLTEILDGNTPEYEAELEHTLDEREQIEADYAELYGDKTYDSFYPQSMGIGFVGADGRLDATNDALTMYHAERVLKKFKPAVTFVSLIDVDACHDDFNGYILGQVVADALVAHLWDTIQSTDGLRDETALLVLPEHGRQLQYNGNNEDSLGRSGLDHGGGDDGDREVWALALGPDFKPGVVETTGIRQDGRTSDRYETIDVVMTAAAILGQDGAMKSGVEDAGGRPGLLMEGILR